MILIFAKMQLENDRFTIFAKKIGKTKVIMNLVVIVLFFEIIYTIIFKCLFARKISKAVYFGQSLPILV